MTILCGDCREILKKLDDTSVDLVYIDPPFFTQKTHSLTAQDHTTERTRLEDSSQLFNWTDDNILVIDAYDLIINSWLEKQERRDKPEQ